VVNRSYEVGYKYLINTFFIEVYPNSLPLNTYVIKLFYVTVYNNPVHFSKAILD